MGELDRGRDTDNVNVTLGRDGNGNPFEGKKFPCCVCSAGLEIRLSKRGKPYCTCIPCGIQIFFRGKTGIRRLTEILRSEKLAFGNSLDTIPAIILFNQIEQMRSQKKELEAKQGLIVQDPDLTNAIRAVDNEIERAQIELAKLSRKPPREKSR
jgi:hypothetical protein